MARCLILACGCRGEQLARSLLADGHVVRATTRDPARARELAERGLDARVADPDRIATIAPALEHVSVLCILLASAAGAPGAIRDLHGSRLEMLLARALDSTVRGIVYEAAGSVDPAVLEQGAERVREYCALSRVPLALIEEPPEPADVWLRAAHGAVAGVL